MVHQKLGAMLAATLLLGQIVLSSDIFAQDGYVPPSIQVASVIQRPDIEVRDGILPDLPLLQKQKPDIYLIELGEGHLPILIQALAQDDGSASVFVNGSEILRFRGEAGGMDAIDRARKVAARLNHIQSMEEKSNNAFKPAIVGQQVVIQHHDEVVATVDPETAKAAGLSPEKLAFSWNNRLRQALGELPLQEKDFPKAFAPSYRATGKTQAGVASWYGPGFHGRRTASGSRFNQYAMTAAHRSLPFGTLVKVTNQRNKKSCVVKINDRGPYAHGRIIDLSKGAAQTIGISGISQVTLEVVQKDG